MRHSDNAAVKIAEKMRERLRTAGNNGTGEFLSSRQAAQIYGVSHVTANRALKILAAENFIRCRRGAAPQIVQNRRRPRIVCFMSSDFRHIPPENCSEAPRRFQLLIEELEKHDCQYKIYSEYDLKQAYYSKSILRHADGLLVEAKNDLPARALAAGFNGPKVWLWSNEAILENGNQILPDFLPGMTAIFDRARLFGIKKCLLHYHRKFFADIMQTAARLSGWAEDDYTLVEHQLHHSQLEAYRYAVNMPVDPRELHVCEVDLTAFGFYQAFTDRGYKAGDFNITGIGNLEGRGHLPLGEACITTLGNDLVYRVQRIVNVLLENIVSGTAKSLIERVPSKLIIRKSAFFEHN